MQKDIPRVSVIMPTYNGEKFVAQAIESVLNQTMKDFELVIVDDASTDGTVKIIKKYRDPRIRFFQNDTNHGIAFNRNRAVAESRAPYITTVDQDDISFPGRLQIQADFMDKHPDFGFLGTWVTLINQSGKPLYITWKNKLAAEKIPATLLFQNNLNNGSVMIRRRALPEGEVFANSPAEDYNLWLRVDKKWKIWNVQKVLFKYRVHDEQSSTTKSAKRREVVKKMITTALARLQIIPTDEELQVHLGKAEYFQEGRQVFVYKKEQWLKKLKQQNNLVKYYDPVIFETVLAEVWLATCSDNATLGLAVWKKFWQSELSVKLNKKENLTLVLAFLIKCALKRNKISLRNIFKGILDAVGLKTVIKKILKL